MIDTLSTVETGEAAPSIGPGDQFQLDHINDSIIAVGRGAQVIVQQATTLAQEASSLQELERAMYAQAVAQLAEGLRTQVLQAPKDKTTLFKSGWYELSDVGRFFGRDTARDAVLDQLKESRFVVLAGSAGLGKTSLLQAAIVPALIAAQHLPLLVRVTSAPLVRHIKQSLLPDLDRALQLALSSRGVAIEASGQMFKCPDLEQVPLKVLLQKVVAQLPPGKEIVIILDQFEAFFKEADQHTRQKFIEELASCLEPPTCSRWLISVRSSHQSSLEQFAPTITQPLANTIELAGLTSAEARLAIHASAELCGIELDAPLLDALIDDLADDPSSDLIQPWKLQRVGRALVGAIRHGAPPTLDIYRQGGAVEIVLREHLQTVLGRDLANDDREPAWHALVAAAARRRYIIPEPEIVTELAQYDVDETQARRILAELENNYLLSYRDALYCLTSISFLPSIHAWSIECRATELARAETKRQVERIRGSALRGLLGGTLGFSLAFLLASLPQVIDPVVRAYMTLPRATFGGLAGLLLILLVDMAIATYQGARRWLRWPIGGLAGATSFAFILSLNYALRFTIGNGFHITSMLLVMLEGGLWGVITGLGTMWIMTSRRRAWQTLPIVVVTCGATLWAAEYIGRAFAWPGAGQEYGTPEAMALVALAGILMPLFVIAAALLGRNTRATLDEADSRCLPKPSRGQERGGI